MDLLKRFWDRPEPEPIEPADTPIYEPGRGLPLQNGTPSFHYHDWAEKRIQAIEATCECGVVELHRDHRGPLKGSSKTRKPLVVTPKGVRRGSAPEIAKRNREWQGYYEAGQDVKAIAALYEVHEDAVYYAFRKLGVTLRPRVIQRGHANPERTAEILRLRQEFWTYDQIGKKFGVSRERVRQILKESGADNHALVEARLNAVAKVRQPKPPSICKFCGEDYTGENWRDHQRRLKHNPNPNADLYAERDRQVAADYAAGMKVVDIQTKYGIDPGSVSRARQRHGLPQRRPGNFLHSKPEIQARKAAIIADIRAGMKQADIAAKYEVSDTLVSLFGKAEGLQTGKYARPTAEEKAQWVTRYQSGLSANAIAKEFNRGQTTVSKHLKKVGASR